MMMVEAGSYFLSYMMPFAYHQSRCIFDIANSNEIILLSAPLKSSMYRQCLVIQCCVCVRGGADDNMKSCNDYFGHLWSIAIRV